MSDTRPFADTSVWASIGVGVGLLYGGLAPAVIDLDDSHRTWRQFLAGSVLLHLLPFGLAVWGAAAWLEGSAYWFLVKWCWGTWAAAAVIVLGAAIYRAFRRS